MMSNNYQIETNIAAHPQDCVLWCDGYDSRNLYFVPFAKVVIKEAPIYLDSSFRKREIVIKFKLPTT